MKIPPFHSNHEDGVHCVICCMKMAVDYLLPGNNITFTQLEKAAAFLPGEGAWEISEVLSYGQFGIEAELVTSFDYGRFHKEGRNYLIEEWGRERAEWEEKHGNVPLEAKRAAKLATSDLHKQKVPTRLDIKQYIDNGWLVMLLINSRTLSNRKGYSGHRVLAYAHDDEGVTMHDPGPPPLASRKVKWALLEKAWADPNDNAKFLIALRKFIV